MKYLFLGLSIVFELLGSSFLKLSNGFTKPLPVLALTLSFITCFYFLSLTLKSIPLGTAYAIWGGIGIVSTTLISVFFFKQKVDFPAVLGIALIVSGVVIMNFFSKTAVH